MQYRLTWNEFRARYHPDAKRDYYLQKKADNEGTIELMHPSHDWVLERIEPEI